MSARRVGLGILIGLGCLGLLLAAVVTLSLSSKTVAKKVFSIALGKSPRGIQIGEIRGPLKGPLVFLHVKYRSGAMSAELDSALIDWKPTRLLLGRLEFRRLHVSGLHIILPDSAPPDTAGLTHARMRRPLTPLPVILGDAFIDGITVDAPGGMTLRDGMVTLGGTLQDYRFAMTADGFAPGLGAVDFHLTGQGNLERLKFDSSTAALLHGVLTGTGRLAWWPRIEWDLALAADSIRPAPLFPHPAKWPGSVTLRATTSGAIDSSGPEGRAKLDSLGGKLRGQLLAGHAEFGFAPHAWDLPVFDVNWGSARLRAQGIIHDTVALSYDLAITDLRTATRRTRGSLQLNGTASGPRDAARLKARLEARNLVSGTRRLRHLAGSADVDLASNGRNAIELRGQQGGLGKLAFDTVVASLHGTHHAHQLALRASGPLDTLRLGLAGGLWTRTWKGSVSALALHTARLGGWRSERPAPLLASLSTGSARLGTLCLAADTSAGRLCASGDWRNSRTWTVLASLESFPAWRLPPGSLAEQGQIVGTLGAKLDMHASGGRLQGSLRAATDTVALVWRRATDKAEHRLALDSAVVEVHADYGTGLRTTLALKLSDEHRKELLSFAGRATLADYRLGAGIRRTPLRFAADGKVIDLGFLQPFVFGLDSLKGGITLSLNGSGSLTAPEVKGTLGVQNFVAGFPGRRAASGTLAATLSGAFGQHRALNTDLRIDARGFGWSYWYYAEQRRLTVDSGSVVLTGDAAGLRGKLGLGVKDLKGSRVASLSGDLALPEYTRLGMPLAPQPVELKLAAEIPDLAALQPLMMSVDSLAGKLRLDVSAKGRVDAPTATATLRLENAKGRMPSGAMAQGGLGADLELAVAGDKSYTGSLKVEPHDASFRYPVGSGSGLLRLDRTALVLKGGADGVRGTLDVTFADSAGAPMGTLEARAALPQLTRINAPLARQPVEATLEGRVADFAFLEALTAQVDSAAGKLNLDAKLSGVLSDSRLVGGVELKDVAMRMPQLGILLKDIQFTGKGDQAGLINVNGKLRSGEGELTLTGTTPVQPSSAHPGHLHFSGTNFEAMNNAELHAVLSGALDVRIAEDSLDVRGAVSVPLAHLMLTQIPASAVAPSDDVILLDSVLVLRRNRPLSADVKIALGDSVSFTGFNFNAQLGGSLLLVQAPDELPTATGTVFIEEGRYRAYGQDLTIRKGEVRFTGGPLDNPALAVTATRDAFNGTERVLVGIRILGTLRDPDVSLFSEPPMAESQVLSFILTGGTVGTGMGGSLWDKALTTLGLRSPGQASSTLNQQVGLNQARLQTAADVRGTALTLGKFLTPKLYVGYAINVFDPISSLRLRYVLSNHFTLLAEAGRVSSADALVKIEPGKKPGQK